MSEPTQGGGLSAIWRYFESCRKMTERDRRNSWKATGWMFVWMVSFASVVAGMKFEVLPQGFLTYVAIAVSTAIGLLAVLAYARFIRQADELQRKIQTEALSLGFGGGFLATFALALLERTELYNPDLGDPFLAMAICYVAGILLAARRYA